MADKISLKGDLAEKSTSKLDPKVNELAQKGDGVLVKRGTVWTYPDAEDCASGSNLRLPVEYVSNTDILRAIADGDLHVVITDGGAPLKVRVAGDEQASAALPAGSAEAGTELPAGSIPLRDAATKAVGQ